MTSPRENAMGSDQTRSIRAPQSLAQDQTNSPSVSNGIVQSPFHLSTSKARNGPMSKRTWMCCDTGTTAWIGTGTSPTPFSSQLSTAMPLSFALRMRHSLASGAGLWCIGQIAWSPCEHVHSTRPASAEPDQKAIGASVNVAAWQRSHAMAIRPSARRRRVLARVHRRACPGQVSNRRARTRRGCLKARSPDADGFPVDPRSGRQRNRTLSRPRPAVNCGGPPVT